MWQISPEWIGLQLKISNSEARRLLEKIYTSAGSE
jgi:hypothetical protein